MKRKLLYTFLGCEAILCIILNFARGTLPLVFTTILAFPFEQIGLGLRILSLSGKPGNLISIILYVIICLIPASVLFLLRKKRRLYAEDALLAILSAVLFSVIYLMINPGLLGMHMGSSEGQSVGKALLGGIAYSVLTGYILLRIIRLFFSADTYRMQKYLMILLYIINILIVLLVFGVQFSSMIDSFKALRTNNAGNEHRLGISYIFLALRYLIDALPNVLIIPVVFSGQNLLNELSVDRYSKEAVTCSEKLSRMCGFALIITVLTNIGYNLLQLVFIKRLSVVNSSVQIPIFSIAFVLAALLLAQYTRENKHLKDDNDMFI